VVENPAEIPRNRFQIVGQLGRGALAEVYLCKLRGVAGFEKEVVVKRISADYAADPLFVRMFLDEARVAARLTHPNIVQVFEVGEEEGVPYIAMEYVRGVTLEMVIRRAHQEGKIHHGHFAAIIAKICDALSYAHSAVDQDGEPVGLVHREVSPANIVLNLDGVPKLLDFGMAAAKDRLLHTQDGMLTGELRYMAPEQVSRGRLDHRADVFSLGITLFELTTGINPFGPPGQRDSDVLQKVLNTPIPRPSQLVSGYPQTLEKIVLSAIERNVDKRCPSAREFRDRLEVFAVKKEHLSTPRSLAAWIRELFPDFSMLTKASEVTAPRVLPTAGGVPVTVSSLRQTGTHEIIPPPTLILPSNNNASTWKWAAFAASGLAVAAAIWALTRTGPAEPTRATSPNPSAGAEPTAAAPIEPPASPDLDAEGKVFIEAAETFAEERRFEPALEMINKATALGVKDRTLAGRLTLVRERVTAELSASKEAEGRTLPAAPPSEREALAIRPDPSAEAEGTSPAAQMKGGPGRFKGRLRPMPPKRSRRAFLESQPAGRRRIEAPASGTRAGGPLAEAAAPTPGPPPPLAPAAPAPPPAPSERPPAPAPTEPAGPPVVAARPPVENAPPPGFVPAGGRPSPPPAQTPARGPTISAVPKAKIPIPALPREYVPPDLERLARVCQAVEESTIFAGVSPEFARGITIPLRRRVGANSPVYPIAMYYFIVTEAALKHDNVTAASNLAAAHVSGHLIKLKNLPGVEKAF
jgi:serine/threonine protein kinase